MAVAITRVFSTNEFDPQIGPDQAYAVFDLAFTMNYPAGGEALDFSGDFVDAQAIAGAMFIGGAPNGLIAQYQQINATTWNILFFVESDGGANTPLQEFGAGAYPAPFTMRVIVHGRPATAAS